MKWHSWLLGQYPGGGARRGSLRLEGQVSRARWFSFSAMVVLVFALWASDEITPEGERTVYTAKCTSGVWEGRRCSARMAAGARYIFRASKERAEVRFIALGDMPSEGAYVDCVVRDGRNWSCTPDAAAKRSIADSLIDGDPVLNPVRPFHRIQKWKWWALRLGLRLGHEALT